VASIAVVWVVLVPYAFPWIGAAWASVILATVLFLHGRQTRSLRQLIDESEADRVPVTVSPLVRPRRAPKGLL
jgi:hypothetical protein